MASRAGCRPGRPDGEGATVREKCVGRNYGTTAALWGLHGAGGVASMLSASTGASSTASREQTAKIQGYEQSAVEATSDVGEAQAAMMATGGSRPGARPLCSSRAMTWRS